MLLVLGASEMVQQGNGPFQGVLLELQLPRKLLDFKNAVI